MKKLLVTPHIYSQMAQHRKYYQLSKPEIEFGRNVHCIAHAQVCRKGDFLGNNNLTRAYATLVVSQILGQILVIYYKDSVVNESVIRQTNF